MVSDCTTVTMPTSIASLLFECASTPSRLREVRCRYTELLPLSLHRTTVTIANVQSSNVCTSFDQAA